MFDKLKLQSLLKRQIETPNKETTIHTSKVMHYHLIKSVGGELFIITQQ